MIASASVPKANSPRGGDAKSRVFLREMAGLPPGPMRIPMAFRPAGLWRKR